MQQILCCVMFCLTWPEGLKPLPCHNLIFSAQTPDGSPGCAALRHEASGRTLMAELHCRRSNSGVVSPECKL